MGVCGKNPLLFLANFKINPLSRGCEVISESKSSNAKNSYILGVWRLAPAILANFPIKDIPAWKLSKKKFHYFLTNFIASLICAHVWGSDLDERRINPIWGRIGLGWLHSPRFLAQKRYAPLLLSSSQKTRNLEEQKNKLTGKQLRHLSKMKQTNKMGLPNTSIRWSSTPRNTRK